MTSLPISKYAHRCTAPSGDMAGSKYSQDVSEYDVMFETTCEVCGEQLATLQQITLHMYAELTSGG